MEGPGWSSRQRIRPTVSRCAPVAEAGAESYEQPTHGIGNPIKLRPLCLL
jgi:hypothetical protein